MSLPAWIGEALKARLEGVSRKDLAVRAERMSAAYRAQGDSAGIREELDALAYATARMPATYAATRYALGEAAARMPELRPKTLLDAGAGPGTASWAAQETWTSLNAMRLIDRNRALLDVARRVGACCGREVGFAEGAIPEALRAEAMADVVVASYALTELKSAEREEALRSLWRLTGELLVIVEPGTPEGFRRLMGLRDNLLAVGGNLVAPCTHGEACPLRANERWCHFSRRLERSRDHRQVKSAEVNYEDEKFCYLAVARQAPTTSDARRVLATPQVTKGEVRARLCAPGGVEEVAIRRTDKEAYKRARHWAWGKAVEL